MALADTTNTSPDTPFHAQILASDDHALTPLASAARGAYIDEDSNPVTSPFQFAMADFPFRESEFRNKKYTMFALKSNTLGPITGCTVAFINKTETARERGALSFIINIDEVTLQLMTEVSEQIHNAARGRAKPPAGVMVDYSKVTANGSGKRKGVTIPPKVKLITPRLEEHEVAGVTKTKKHWPAFNSGTKSILSKRGDKTYNQLEARFNIPRNAMPTAYQQANPWYKGTQVNDFDFLDIMTSETPEATEFNVYIAPAFLMKTEDPDMVDPTWTVKWKITALESLAKEKPDSTMQTLGLRMISNNEWDARPPLINTQPNQLAHRDPELELSDSDDDSDDEPLAKKTKVRSSGTTRPAQADGL